MVFACEEFDKCTFGCGVVQVEADHKPLEEFFKSSFHYEAARLQHLRLQRYNLVRCKKGTLMLIVNTFIRAHVDETLSSRQVRS